ncbi:MAG: TldD/PmbA family protein [Candidatus Diapherotrites archaeon]
MLEEKLDSVVDDLLNFVLKKPNVRQAEAFASISFASIFRIAYHSKITSNGVEEAKLLESKGISLRVLFDDGSYGFGSCDNGFSRHEFEEAYQKALKSKVKDLDFHSLPEPKGKSKFKPLIDSKIKKFDAQAMAKNAWSVLDGAIEEAKHESMFNITGELDTFFSSFCVMNSNGIKAKEQNTGFDCSITSNIESESVSSGTSFASGNSFENFNIRKIGAESMQKALASKNPKHVESGKHKVLLSELVVAELFNSRFDVYLSSLDLGVSPFSDLVDKKVASENFSVLDDPFYVDSYNSTGLTDEGNPSGRVEIIKNGVFQNFLSNDYFFKKRKEYEKFQPLNGYRTNRSYSSEVSIMGRNFVVSKGDFSEEELLKEVNNGIYIGRIWYTYPINGSTSFDYSSTIRSDSFIIENGEISCALLPNSVRIIDSFSNFMKNIVALGKNLRQAHSWAQDELVITPKICLNEMNLKRIRNI